MPSLLERALRAVQSATTPRTAPPSLPPQQDPEQFQRQVATERQRLLQDIDQEQQRLRQRMLVERRFRELISPAFTAAAIDLVYDFHPTVGPYAYLDVDFATMPVRYSLWSLPDPAWLRLQGRSLHGLFPWVNVAVANAPQRLLECVARDYRQWSGGRAPTA